MPAPSALSAIILVSGILRTVSALLRALRDRHVYGLKFSIRPGKRQLLQYHASESLNIAQTLGFRWVYQ